MHGHKMLTKLRNVLAYVFYAAILKQCCINSILLVLALATEEGYCTDCIEVVSRLIHENGDEIRL